MLNFNCLTQSEQPYQKQLLFLAKNTIVSPILIKLTHFNPPLHFI